MSRNSEEPVFNQIEQIRTAQGLSRQELADLVGVHYQTIGYLERGEYSPSLVLALRIAKALKREVSELFSLTEQKKRKEVMSKKNKIYWGLGVTEKGTRALLTDENSKFKWLRSQRNRRILVVLYALGILVVSLGSYYPTLKTNLNISSESGITILVVTGIWVVLSVLIGYSLLRVAVRGIAEAPDELLDERQIVSQAAFLDSAFLISCVFTCVNVLSSFSRSTEEPPSKRILNSFSKKSADWVANISPLRVSSKDRFFSFPDTLDTFTKLRS